MPRDRNVVVKETKSRRGIANELSVCMPNHLAVDILNRQIVCHSITAKIQKSAMREEFTRTLGYLKLLITDQDTAGPR